MFFQRGHVNSLRYVSRGNILVWDYNIGDFTLDTDWHILDISSKITPNTVLAHVELLVKSHNAGEAAYFRPHDYQGYYLATMLSTQEGEVLSGIDFFLRTDSDGKIDYRFLGYWWNAIYFGIKGYFVAD